MKKILNKEKFLDYFFTIGIVFKGLDGLLEIIGGILLWLLSPETINSLIIQLTQHELVEDPNDIIANMFLQASHQLSIDIKIFGAIYLFSHGIIKVVLVVSLLRKKLWSYPAAIIVFLLFIIYQVYRYTYAPSWGLVLLTLFDFLIIILTWREYKHIKKTVQYIEHNST